jgi:hypothetical protein
MPVELAPLIRTEDRFTVAVWRTLRQRATALDRPTVERLAAGAGLRDEALEALLHRSGELDEAGRLAGLGGLSTADHPHHLILEGVALSAWCAWDPFFLVPALGEGDATLETSDPISGSALAVQFADGAPVAASGVQPVLSMVRTRGDTDRSDKAGGDSARPAGIEELWSSFCGLVHLFESPATAARFFDGRDAAFDLLSIPEAARLAEETHASILRAARDLRTAARGAEGRRRGETA